MIFDAIYPEEMSIENWKFLLEEFKDIHCKTEWAKFYAKHLIIDGNTSTKDVVTCGLINGTIDCRNITKRQLDFVFVSMKHQYLIEYYSFD